MTDEPGWGLRYLDEHWQEWMDSFMPKIESEVKKGYGQEPDAKINFNYTYPEGPAGEQGQSSEVTAEITYLKTRGLEPTPDAIAQLRYAFLPALEIMCKRGYDPDGQTWKLRGWRGLVHHILDKAERFKFHSWNNSRHDRDSALDLINYCGFYIRLENQGEPWGTWGPPGE